MPYSFNAMKSLNLLVVFPHCITTELIGGSAKRIKKMTTNIRLTNKKTMYCIEIGVQLLLVRISVNLCESF